MSLRNCRLLHALTVPALSRYRCESQVSRYCLFDFPPVLFREPRELALPLQALVLQCHSRRAEQIMLRIDREQYHCCAAMGNVEVENRATEAGWAFIARPVNLNCAALQRRHATKGSRSGNHPAMPNVQHNSRNEHGSRVMI